MSHFDIFGLHLRDFIRDIVLRMLKGSILWIGVLCTLISESDYNQWFILPGNVILLFEIVANEVKVFGSEKPL